MTNQFPTPHNFLWRARVAALMKDGFSREEARWGADNKLRLGGSQVKLVRDFRKLFIKDFMKTFKGTTRAQAIKQAAAQLRGRNVRFGLTGADVNNIFREISN